MPVNSERTSPMPSAIFRKVFAGQLRRLSPGFTLVEMMAVMVVVVLMATLAIPAFRNFYETMQEDAVTSKLARVLRFAHQKGVYQSATTSVFIDLEEQKFWVHVPEDEDDRFSEEKRELEYSLPKGFTFDSVYKPLVDETITRDRARIFFHPDGTAEEVAIVITSEKFEKEEQRRVLLHVKPNTGKVLIQELDEDTDAEEALEEQ